MEDGKKNIIRIQKSSKFQIKFHQILVLNLMHISLKNNLWLKMGEKEEEIMEEIKILQNHAKSCCMMDLRRFKKSHYRPFPPYNWEIIIQEKDIRKFTLMCLSIFNYS